MEILKCLRSVILNSSWKKNLLIATWTSLRDYIFDFSQYGFSVFRLIKFKLFLSLPTYVISEQQNKIQHAIIFNKGQNRSPETRHKQYRWRNYTFCKRQGRYVTNVGKTDFKVLIFTGNELNEIFTDVYVSVY